MFSAFILPYRLFSFMKNNKDDLYKPLIPLGLFRLGAGYEPSLAGEQGELYYENGAAGLIVLYADVSAVICNDG